MLSPDEPARGSDLSSTPFVAYTPLSAPPPRLHFAALVCYALALWMQWGPSPEGAPRGGRSGCTGTFPIHKGAVMHGLYLVDLILPRERSAWWRLTVSRPIVWRLNLEELGLQVAGIRWPCRLSWRSPRRTRKDVSQPRSTERARGAYAPWPASGWVLARYGPLHSA